MKPVVSAGPPLADMGKGRMRRGRENEADAGEPGLLAFPRSDNL